MCLPGNYLKFVAALLVTGFTGFSTAFGASNPLIRTCTINLGTFEVYPLGADDMALCRWSNIIVDSQTLVSNLNGVDTEAALFVLNDSTSDSCAASSLTEISIPTGETICAFQDGSKLSVATLKAGLTDPNRLHLKEVLLAR